MRRFFCDCCGVEITDPADRYSIAFYDRVNNRRKTELHFCADDIKKVRNMKFIPQKNVRIRKIPAFISVIESHLKSEKTLYMIPEWNVDQIRALNKKDPCKLRTKDGHIFYTKEYVLSRIDGSFKPEESVKKLLEYTQLLYNKQTEDEKKSYETKYHNNVGFNKSDAQFMSAMAMVSFNRGIESLSEKQIAEVVRRFPKYAEQVANLLNEQYD